MPRFSVGDSKGPENSYHSTTGSNEKDVHSGHPHQNGYTYDPDLAHPTAGYGDVATSLDLDSVNQRKLLTKIDLRVIPVLSVMYLLAFLDRTNISNARIFNMEADLRLRGNQFNTALVIFFVPYILFEIPSNIILKRLKPHVWLSICMFLFGLITICQGLVSNYAGLLTTRFFLGLFEAGMFPGSFYLISMWYTRPQAQKRYTFFFASTTLAGAFGGLLASAIGKMQGVRGYNGWRWIFILEGLLTCVISFGWWFAIPDFPEDAKWLSEAERELHKRRLQADVGKSALERRIQPRDVFRCFKDPRFILGGVMYFGLIVPAYGYAYFAPTIIRSYGYSAIQTQLHSVPPWVAAFGFSMLVATFSDFFRHRFLFIMLPIGIAITGFAILMTVHTNRDVQYAALHLVTSGIYSAMPIIVCWYTMNLSGHHRRSVGSAWQIGFGNIGGIIASFSITSDQARTFFFKGYSICMGFICLSAAACLLYFVLVLLENKRRDKITHNGEADVGLSEYEKAELGDLNPEYRYML